MDTLPDYFSTPHSKDYRNDNLSWQGDWNNPLHFWDLQNGLESPSLIATPPASKMNHPNDPRLMLRESPMSMYSLDDTLVGMPNAMNSLSVMPQDGSYRDEYLIQDHELCRRPQLAPYALSSPAFFHGFPLTPMATPTQPPTGLGIAGIGGDQEELLAGHSPRAQEWEEVKLGSTHLAPPPATSPNSKRTAANMSDRKPAINTKAKRMSPKSRHRRSMTETMESQTGGKVTKLAHNIVERNYRDRLNDQIAELSKYLFDSANESKGRSRPPKSLVISAAKEKLMELSSQNEELMMQISNLKQQIAVLEHITGARHPMG